MTHVKDLQVLVINLVHIIRLEAQTAGGQTRMAREYPAGPRAICGTASVVSKDEYVVICPVRRPEGSGQGQAAGSKLPCRLQ